jgi:hypothetical protein
MKVLLTPDPNSWRHAFQIIGAAGLVWIAAWFFLIRSSDLGGSSAEKASTANPSSEASSTLESGTLWDAIFSRKMLVVLIVIAMINTWWQLLRAWLPKVLQEGRGYAESDVLNFLPFFYIATDVGVIASGFLTVFLHKRGCTVHGARLGAFGTCAVLSALAVVAAFTPRGPLLLVLLMIMGAGALGLFPIYHALTQDFPSRYQGTISGLGGVAAWILSFAQKYYGRLIDQTKSFDMGFAFAGAMPFVAFLVLFAFWPKTGSDSKPLTAKAH